MSEDVKMKVVGAVSFAMANIFGEPDNSFKWLPEAASLIQKWVDDYGAFGVDGIVEATLWWQDQASDENPFPLTSKEVHCG
jgi:hypothetical protein